MYSDLSTENPLSYESTTEVIFHEASHRYYIRGGSWAGDIQDASGEIRPWTPKDTWLYFPMSASGVKKKYEPPFCGRLLVNNGFAKWSEDAQSPYFQLIQAHRIVLKESDEQIKELILTLWNQSGKEAATKGTDLHLQIERYFNGVPYEIHDERLWRMFQNWHERWFRVMYGGMVPFRTEFNVFDLQYKVAGQPDMLAKDADGRLHLIDWKTCKCHPDKKDGSLHFIEEKFNPYNKKMKGMCKQVPANDFGKYLMQQNLYKYMFEKCTGMTIDFMWLVQFPTAPASVIDYAVIAVPEFSNYNLTVEELLADSTQGIHFLVDPSPPEFRSNKVAGTKRPLDTPPFLVVKTHTTDINGYVISLACVGCGPEQIGEAWHAYLDMPTVCDAAVIAPDAQKIHGLTAEFLHENGANATNKMREFFELVNQVVNQGGHLVFHNAEFEIKALNRTAEKLQLPHHISEEMSICTMKTSTDKIKLTDDPERAVYKYPKLGELSAHLIPEENAAPSGQAKEDAMLIARCFVEGLQIEWW